MPTRIISIMNQKGGVGKTTTTLNLGAALASAGKHVLLVDLDPQANLTYGLGMITDDLSESVYELLINSKCETASLIKETPFERLCIIPSHIDLSGAEIELVPVMGRETRLKRSLDSVKDAFDYILIDCLPSLSLLTVNAMVASNEFLVPLQAHPFALQGLGKLLEVTQMLKEALNPDLHLSGVLITMYDSRTNVSKETTLNLQEDERLAPHLFKTLIKSNIKIAESQKDGVPVIHFDPNCPGAKAYIALGEEVLEMESSGCLASEARARITSREVREQDQASRKSKKNPVAQKPKSASPAPKKTTATFSPKQPSDEPKSEPVEDASTDSPPQPIHAEQHPEPQPTTDTIVSLEQEIENNNKNKIQVRQDIEAEQEANAEQEVGQVLKTMEVNSSNTPEPCVMPHPWQETPHPAAPLPAKGFSSSESFRRRLATICDPNFRPRLNLVSNREKKENEAEHNDGFEDQKNAV